MKKYILFIFILISTHVFSQSYTIQNYTITSVNRQKENEALEDYSANFHGKLLTYDPNNDRFVINTSATENVIYKIVSIPNPNDFYDKDNRHVFIFNCTDNNAQTCKIYLSYPPKDSHGLDVTLVVTYEWHLTYMFYLKAFV